MSAKKYIAPERASDYGVVLDPASGEVDLRATEALRQKLRQERKAPARNSRAPDL